MRICTMLLPPILMLMLVGQNVHSFCPVNLATVGTSCTRYGINKNTQVNLADNCFLLSESDSLSSVASGMSDAGGISSVISPTVATVLLASYTLFKFAVYSRMQLVTASIISGIPANSNVVEINAVDGKNVFYLANSIDYTAVMQLPKGETDEKKIKEKMRINEQLILECIGKANAAINDKGKNIKGKIRTKTQDIPGRSVDCVISTGSLAKADNAQEILQEVHRMLKPAGLFVFVEPDRNNVIDKMNKVFMNDSKVIGGKKDVSDKVRGRGALIDQELESVEDTEPSRSSSDDSDKEEDGSKSDSTVKAVGVTYERLVNLIDPYITGIAVKQGKRIKK